MNSDEFKFANRSFISRHPAATNWIHTHSFYLCKLEIVQIVVLDWYGGPHYVSNEDYYNAKTISNGFLGMDNGFATNALKLADDDTQMDRTDNVNGNSNDDKKIKIRIERGSDAVTIEL